MANKELNTTVPPQGAVLEHAFTSSAAWSLTLTAAHPMLANHKVHGEALLPGLAWIDLLFQWFAAAGYRHDSLMLKNVTIHRPLIAHEGQPVRMAILANESDGVWKVRIRQQCLMQESALSAPYLTAEMHPCLPAGFGESVDLEQIQSSAPAQLRMSQFYEQCRRRQLMHTGIMVAEGEVHRLGADTWLRLRVNPPRMAEAVQPSYLFHPVLIDASAIASQSVVERFLAGEQRLFLPLFYQSFRASEPFVDGCWARIRDGEVAAKGELISISVDFFNHKGNKIGELKGLQSKLVRDPALLRAAGGVQQPAPGRPHHTGFEQDGQEGLRSSSMEVLLRDIIAGKLAVSPDQLATDRGYYELGLTSSMLLEVVESLATVLKTSLPPTLPFEYTTIAALAEHLSLQYDLAAADRQREQVWLPGRANKSISPAVAAISTTHSRSPASRALRGAQHRAMGVAVIGLAGRYPQADNIREFWENLKQGRDCITQVPEERWHGQALEAIRSPSGKAISRWGGFIEHADCFDPQFFRMSAREAELTDPQERLFLQVCWEAIEDAGYTPDNLVRKNDERSRQAVGVFVGVMHKDYSFVQADAARAGDHIPISLSDASIANRVSYFCNFHGPSMAIDTVCSASLTAVHLARQSILAGESALALAGGVNLSLHPLKYRTYGLMDMHSSDGHCRSFGAGGDGYVSAEGVGAVLLKPLEQAMLDRDHIYAVLKSSAINHGGAGSGITVPSPLAQAELIADCLTQAEVHPQTIGYVEAHGTGTSLGDPIEIQGLQRAFARFTDQRQFCALGSVKSNIGHAESAAGISGLTKVVLQLHHRTLVKSLHAQVINPHLDLAATAFYIQQVTEPWRRPQGMQEFPRRAAVSSFGATGANAHVIVEECPPPPVAEAPGHRKALLPVSAKTQERLREYVVRLRSFLLDNAQVNLQEVAFTLQTGRVALEERLVVAASTAAEAAQKFSEWLDGPDEPFETWQGSIRTQITFTQPKGEGAVRQSGIEELIGPGELAALARQWVQGAAVDWSQLYVEQQPRRISLPTYPFARERYFVTPVRDSSAAGASHTSATAPQSVAPVGEQSQELSQVCYFQEYWEEAPLQSVAAQDDPGPIIIFASAGRERQLIEAAPASISKNAVWIHEAGEGLSQCEHARRCRADDSVAIQALLQEIAAAAGKSVSIVYTWAMDQGESGVHALFSLFKAIHSAAGCIAHLTLVGHYDPACVDTCWDYSWIGFERSLRLTLPHLRLSLLYSSSSACTAAQVLDALSHRGVIWYREGRRFVLASRRVDLPASGNAPVLTVNGTYLITGGCGALGYALASHLAGQCKAKLYLIGRSPWSARIEEQLIALRQSGAQQAHYFSVDICDEAALTEFARPLPRLSGIIHAAGVESSQVLAQKSRADVQRVLQPKTLGTLLLDAVLGPSVDDFVCYFSSAAAILGDLGACDYAIGNRFLMAYGHHRNRVGSGQCKTIVINWPLWRTGGMGPTDVAAQAFYLKSSGQQALDTAAGIAIWQDLMRVGWPQSLVLLGKRSRLEPMLARMYASHHLIAESGPASSEIAAKGARVRSQGRSLRQCLIEDLQQLISRTLKTSVEKLRPTDNLADFGFDSLTLGSFARQLSDHFALQVTPALFFSYTSIAKLADHFAQAHADQLQVFYGLAGAPSQTENDPACDAASAGRPPAPTQVAQEAFAPVAGIKSAGGMTQPVAIIGLSGRFPQARDVDQLWTLLAQGRSAITEIPLSRWDWREYFTGPGERGNRINSNQGGFIDGVDEFDALFFEVSPREAQQMDPGERLLLMEAYKAIEDAAVDPSSLRGRAVGCFVGMEESQYGWVIDEQGITTGGTAMVSSRLSYFLDLHGPTVATNTACSSALVALHQATMSLQQGECEAALVAGISLTLSARSYVLMSQAGMISVDGLCRSFSNQANGIGVGEAVVVLMLMPLAAAIADGHPIYAVIRASGINFDGRTHGVTAPNGRMQAELIETIYRRYGVNANDVTHMVSHGTGTKLGDSVELHALNDAYKRLLEQRDTQTCAADKHSAYCAITSCKSNFGHTMAASGLVSVVALLKGMQHRQIPASLHCEVESDYIEWSDSPFFVNKCTRRWELLPGQPRIGAVSAFGRSGTNAHVVLEAFSQPSSVQSGLIVHGALAICLSARTAQQLLQQADNLLDFLNKQAGAADLPSIAYTLQVGRQAMDERLGFVIDSGTQLRELLQSYVDGAQRAVTPRGIHRGSLSGNEQTADLFNTDPDLRRTVQHWLSQRKLDKLLELWVKGLAVDWRQLYDREIPPQRLHLPTYPFATDRYWPEIAKDHGARLPAGPASTVLHPLLHQNTSTLSRQSYRTTFSGEEFFFRDHLVQGERTLPGVAYLEMARVAVQDAAPAGLSGNLSLRNLVWVQPLVVGTSTQTTITLAADDDGHIDFEVDSGDREHRCVHCQGQAIFGAPHKAPARSIADLQARMRRGVLEHAEIYAAFSHLGLDYGPGHRGLTCIYRGEGELLARLRLPQQVAASLTTYVLHPTLMDSALQSAIGLGERAAILGARPFMPFALDALHVWAGCTEEMFAWVRSAAHAEPDNPLLKVDVDLFNESGALCVQMQGFSCRELHTGRATNGAAAPQADTLFAMPTWEPAQARGSSHADSLSYAKRYVLLCEMPYIAIDHLQALVPRSQCLHLQAPSGSTLAERYTLYATSCFDRMQSILREKPSAKILLQIVVEDAPQAALFTGLSGLLKTAMLENPQVVAQLVLTPPRVSIQVLAQQLNEDAEGTSDSIIRHAREGRYGLRFAVAPGQAQARSIEGRPAAIAFKDHGVYLITGGLGGLGTVFAEEILKQSTRAQVILTGRSAMNAQRLGRVDKLSAGSGRLEYQQLDVNDFGQVKQVIERVQQQYGRISGILHCAGVIHDAFILKKTREDFSEVLAPKVQGAFNLDLASRDVDLDFIVFFSSVSAAFGNVGQADYASANGFLDQFAAYRNGLVASQQRRGLTLAINWPLWQAGGMSTDEAHIGLLQQHTGMQPLPTPAGLRAFHRCLQYGAGQVIVMHGEVRQLHRTLSAQRVAKPAWLGASEGERAQPALARPQSGHLAEFTTNFLCRQIATWLKLAVDQLDPQAPLERYGIDSILALQLTNQLELTFGSLSKTLFFEYKNIRELTQYFLEEHQDRLATLMVEAASAGAAARGQHERGADIATADGASASSARRFARVREGTTQERGVPVTRKNAVAVVGLSGRFPQAMNLEEYWRNLQEGKDCISEIPAQRWNWREYYGDDARQAGQHRSKWGGFIAGVDEFDPAFFDIAPELAPLMDPQERLFLQQAWAALEDAGVTRASLQIPRAQGLAGQVGVYVGVMYSEYQLLGIEAGSKGRPVAVSSSYASIANRVSYHLNLHGPSMTLDSMCSSSLAAIHLARQDLAHERTDLGLAGGVNLSIHPSKYGLLSAGHLLSSGERCQSFGDGGDGYIPGEGVGAVVLKRLSDALRDGNPIYGILPGSALNHGGKTNGYGVPDPKAQADVISMALCDAHIEPRHVSYVEAHGTGTRLGDAIEIAALNKAFRQHTADQGFCLIGSVKSNIGHLEAAAGVAALTKVLLQMKHRQIVPSLHSSVLNPHIDFACSPFRVSHCLQAWERPVIAGQVVPRIAGISAFGAGGANAHLIVQEYIPAAEGGTDTSPCASAAPAVIPLSARTAAQLLQKARDLLGFLNRQAPQTLASIAYTLQVGREAMQERAGWIVESIPQLIQQLDAFVRGEPGANILRGRLEDGQTQLGRILQDEVIQEATDQWIARKNWQKLLNLWVVGLDVDWRKLYESAEPGAPRPALICLPTYPFAREPHWLPVQGAGHQDAPTQRAAPGGCKDACAGPANDAPANGVQAAARNTLGSAPTGQSQATYSNLEEKAGVHVRHLVAQHLRKASDEVDVWRSYQELGLTSLALVNLSRALQETVGESFQLSLLFEHGTVSALAAYLAKNHPAAIEALVLDARQGPQGLCESTDRCEPGAAESPLAPARDGAAGERSAHDGASWQLAQFPELVSLNRAGRGRPVFWFHGGLGGVQPYHVFAQSIERPFFGIQARGYQTDRAPLRGIHALAAYYVHIIRSVQADGPYDLGGYSMGGLIAYEVARQLQELGAGIGSIVMLDTLDNSHHSIRTSKDDMLLAANATLLPQLAHAPAQMHGRLIHCREVDATRDDEAFLEQLLTLAQQRGAGQNRHELKAMVTQIMAILHAYDIENFPLLPLQDPQGAACYYFRNKNGRFLGDLAPYFSVAAPADALDRQNYWAGWVRAMPGLQIFDLDASSHALFLMEPRVTRTIGEFCQALYSQGGVTAAFLEGFRVSTRELHGSLS